MNFPHHPCLLPQRTSDIRNLEEVRVTIQTIQFCTSANFLLDYCKLLSKGREIKGGWYYCASLTDVGLTTEE